MGVDFFTTESQRTQRETFGSGFTTETRRTQIKAVIGVHQKRQEPLTQGFAEKKLRETPVSEHLGRGLAYLKAWDVHSGSFRTSSLTT